MGRSGKAGLRTGKPSSWPTSSSMASRPRSTSCSTETVANDLEIEAIRKRSPSRSGACASRSRYPRLRWYTTSSSRTTTTARPAAPCSSIKAASRSSTSAATAGPSASHASRNATQAAAARRARLPVFISAPLGPRRQAAYSAWRAQRRSIKFLGQGQVIAAAQHVVHRRIEANGGARDGRIAVGHVADRQPHPRSVEEIAKALEPALQVDVGGGPAWNAHAGSVVMEHAGGLEVSYVTHVGTGQPVAFAPGGVEGSPPGRRSVDAEQVAGTAEAEAVVDDARLLGLQDHLLVRHRVLGAFDQPRCVDAEVEGSRCFGRDPV